MPNLPAEESPKIFPFCAAVIVSVKAIDFIIKMTTITKMETGENFFF